MVGGGSDLLLQLLGLGWGRLDMWKWTTVWAPHVRGSPSQNPLLIPVVAEAVWEVNAGPV